MTCIFLSFPPRMRGSAQSAGSIIHHTRNTACAAGPYARTGTKTSPDSPIPSLSLTSQHAAPSPPMTRKTTVTQVSMSRTAAGQCRIPSSCPPTPRQTGPYPQCSQAGAKGLGPPASTKTSSCQKGRARKVWAWRLRKSGPRLCWSPASSVECDHAMEISYTDVRLTC